MLDDAARERLAQNFEALMRSELGQVDINRMTLAEIEALTTRIRKQIEVEIKLELVAVPVGDNG